MNFKQQEIILGVGGGIAAYKSVELLRLLVKAGARVRVIMTPNATRFVGPLTFEALSGRPVCMDLFTSDSASTIRHIEWAQTTSAVVVAPATANIIGKLAGGIADDALSTFMLAVKAPRLICPSMNSDMFLSAPVQRNLQRLIDDGLQVLQPGQGDLACGISGPGRLPEPDVIFDRLVRLLTPQDMAGQRVLITAGPTHEPLDPVRYLTNLSSGKMGYALARAAEHRGATVVLVSGPSHLEAPSGVTLIKVRTAREMAQTVFDNLESVHIVIKAAAVSDYRPVSEADQKIKKTEDAPQLALVRNPDILHILGERRTHQMLVGFAAETQHLHTHALEKMTRKHLDLMVGNLVGRPDSGFQVDTNQVTLFYRDGRQEPLALMPKNELAHVILDRILEIKSSSHANLT